MASMANMARRLEVTRLEAQAMADIESLRGFEMSLGKSAKEATRIAVETTKNRYPQIADSKVFKLAK